MKLTIAAAVLGLSLCGWVSAGDAGLAPSKGPATRPSTQPSPERIAQLIRQLGDDEYRAREQASEELRKIGPAALPALKGAAGSGDPEVKARAQALAQAIENKGRPVAEEPAPLHEGRIGGVGGGGIVIRMGAFVGPGRGGTRNITIVEDGKTIKVQEDKDGITVTVTEPKGEGTTTTEYKAKNAEELKKEKPEGYKYYEKATGKTNIQPGGAKVQMRIGGQ